MRPQSSHPYPGSIESNRLTTADFVGSTGVHDDSAAAALADLEFFTGIETQFSPPSTRGFEDTESTIQSTQAFSGFDVVEHENDHSETAEFMTSLGGEAWALDEGEFGEFYNGIDSHFDSLTIGGPEVFGGQMEATLPYFSGTDIPEIDDVDLSTAGFTDSLIGLENFQSRNVLVDEHDDDAHNTELRIDELFNKVFQLVGVARLPFIHLLLRLDEVSRAARFRYHVSWLENMVGLPKDRALWLLALSW